MLGWKVNRTTAAALTRVTAPRQANRLALVPVARRYCGEADSAASATTAAPQQASRKAAAARSQEVGSGSSSGSDGIGRARRCLRAREEARLGREAHQPREQHLHLEEEEEEEPSLSSSPEGLRMHFFNVSQTAVSPRFKKKIAGPAPDQMSPLTEGGWGGVFSSSPCL